jgi:hypothetical protein
MDMFLLDTSCTSPLLLPLLPLPLLLFLPLLSSSLLQPNLHLAPSFQFERRAETSGQRQKGRKKIGRRQKEKVPGLSQSLLCMPEESWVPGLASLLLLLLHLPLLVGLLWSLLCSFGSVHCLRGLQVMDNLCHSEKNQKSVKEGWGGEKTGEKEEGRGGKRKEKRGERGKRKKERGKRKEERGKRNEERGKRRKEERGMRKEERGEGGNREEEIGERKRKEKYKYLTATGRRTRDGRAPVVSPLGRNNI